MGRDLTSDRLDADAREARIEDAQGLANARKAAEDSGATKPWWKQLGPGLITGAADNDPAGIGAYSVAGAQFGYQLLAIPSTSPAAWRRTASPAASRSARPLTSGYAEAGRSASARF